MASSSKPIDIIKDFPMMYISVDSLLSLLGVLYCLFVMRLNVPVNQFFSHVGTEPPLPMYYPYFRGLKCLAQ